MKKVLFICLGNICRSPSAEGIFKKLVHQKKLDDKIMSDSAGTSAYHEGEPADGRMQFHALNRGYNLESISRGLKHPSDYDDFDYLITMDDSNFKNVIQLDFEKKYRHKILKMTNFCKIHDVHEVPDPYYGGDQGFELVLDILEDASEQLLIQLIQELQEEK